MMNRCGCACEECASWPAECPGCEQTRGTPYWTQHVGLEACPIYVCCTGRAHADCGECEESPCQTWVGLKDPSLSDEEHRKSIEERVNSLTRK
jgi:hypothetical protein